MKKPLQAGQVDALLGAIQFMRGLSDQQKVQKAPEAGGAGGSVIGKFEFHCLFHPSKDHYILGKSLGESLGEGQYGTTVRAAVGTVDQAQDSACFNMGCAAECQNSNTGKGGREDHEQIHSWHGGRPRLRLPALVNDPMTYNDVQILQSVSCNSSILRPSWKSWTTLTSSNSSTLSAMPGPFQPLHSQFLFLTLCYTFFGHSCQSQPLVDVERTVHVVMERCDVDLAQLLDERTKLQDQRLFQLAAHRSASFQLAAQAKFDFRKAKWGAIALPYPWRWATFTAWSQGCRHLGFSACMSQGAL